MRWALPIVSVVLGTWPAVMASPPRARPVLAGCGPVLKPGAPLPTGAKLIGRLPVGGLPLISAEMTNDAPQAANPEKGLSEIEPDDGLATATVTVFDKSDPRPLSVACGYGVRKTPPFAQAFLIIPIPDRASGECRFSAVRASQVMVCTSR